MESGENRGEPGLFENSHLPQNPEHRFCEMRPTHMYIGGGILGTILIILVIIYLAKRV